MHEHFPDWHRDAGIEPNAETSPKHAKALDEYRPTSDEIISFARLFYGLSKQEDTSLDKFGTALRTADPTLSTRDSKQLMTVLAGAELVAVIKGDEGEQLSDLAALCLVCGAAQGLRSAVPVPELPTIAARYIEDRTSKRTSIQSGKTEEDSDSRVERLEHELKIVSEEANMLWWLVSEYSRDQNESWKVLGMLATPIIAGKELADLTRVVPGPVAALAFLDRITRLSDSAKSPKAIKVKEAIDKTPREWRERYASKSQPAGLEYLMPISSGVRLSLTVSDGHNWSAVFEKGTAILANSTTRPNILAYQVFLERLLARLPGEIE